MFTKLKNIITDLIHKTHGQSMVEFAVAMPALILLLWAGLYIADMYIVKHKTLAAARYGTWKYARGEQTSAEIKTNIAKYYFDNNASGLYVTTQSTPADFQNVGRVVTTIADEVLDIINGVMTDQENNISSLKIQYEMPPKLGALDISDLHPGNYKIESSHYVVANGWDGCHSDVHDLFSLLWESIEEIFTKLATLGL